MIRMSYVDDSKEVHFESDSEEQDIQFGMMMDVLVYGVSEEISCDTEVTSDDLNVSYSYDETEPHNNEVDDDIYPDFGGFEVGDIVLVTSGTHADSARALGLEGKVIHLIDDIGNGQDILIDLWIGHNRPEGMPRFFGINHKMLTLIEAA